MKKSIKYGGAALTAATAALAMSGAAFAGTNVATSYNPEDCSIVFGDVEDATSSTSLTAQADQYTSSKVCYEQKATAAKNYLIMPAIASGVYNANDIAVTGENASAALAELKAKYGVENFDDADLMSALKVAEEGETSPWDRMVAETDDQFKDSVVLEKIKTAAASDPNYSDAKAIISDFKKVNNLKLVLSKIDEMNVANSNAKSAEDEAKRLSDAAVAAGAAEEAKAAAELKKAALNEATSDAEAAISAAKDAGASEEDVKALEDALKDAKEGKDVDLSELVVKANEAQAQAVAATKAADDADAAAKTAASNRGFAIMDEAVKKNAVNNAKNDLEQAKQDLETAKSTLETAIEAYEEAVGTAEEADKKSAMNEQKEVVKAAEKAVADKEAALTAAEQAYADAKQALTDATQAKADADIALITANKAKEDAVRAAEETAGLAQAIEGAAGEIENVSDVAKVAQKYAEKAETAAKNAEKALTGEEDEPTTPEDPTDPTDPEDPTDPTDPTEPEIEVNPETGEAYTYKVINGEDQTYTDGESLSFEFDGNNESLAAVYINGELLDEKYYEVTKGSTIITLSNEYLATLPADTYTLTAKWNDGSTQNVAFAIAEAEVETTTPDTGAFTAENGSAVSSLVGVIMTATLAGAAVVLRKRSA